MNKKEEYSGCVFLNMLSELKSENKEIYEIIKSHKLDLQQFFSENIADNMKAFKIYMLFE